MSLILFRFASLRCLAATHLSSPGNGLSWPKLQCTCNAMGILAWHSTNEGVLRSNSACSMLMSDDLRLPIRGIEPWPSRFREVDSTARPLPLPVYRMSHVGTCAGLGWRWRHRGVPKPAQNIPVYAVAGLTVEQFSIASLRIYKRNAVQNLTLHYISCVLIANKFVK